MTPLPGWANPVGTTRSVVRFGWRTTTSTADTVGRAAVDAVLGSRLTAYAVRTFVEGPLVDVAMRSAIRAGLVERIASELLDSGVADRVIDHALATPLPRHVADQLLAGGVAEQIAERVVAGPELDRLLTTALDSPRMAALAERALDSDGMDRLVGQVLDSRLVDASVARVLASDELWLVVDEVAQSPAVTAAITQQGRGFATQVAGEVGQRSRRADARLERAARKLLRRAPPPADVTPSFADPEPS
jgi:hypothetical protein